MSCLRPSEAWQDLARPGSKLIWSIKHLDSSDFFYNSDHEFVSSRYRKLVIPCGKCLLCRKSRAWEITIRALMEFQALPPGSKRGCFVTLTVNDEFLSEVFPGGILRHKPFQDFMKRLRRKCEREMYGFGEDVPKIHRRSLRFLMCGEYGEKSRRPHYHVCFFGEDFTELHEDVLAVKDDTIFGVPVRSTVLRPGRWYSDGSRCDSPFIAECWPFGNVMCRPLDENAMAYTAGYSLKLDPLDTDDSGEQSYEDFWHSILQKDELTPDSRQHNYSKWSRRPGLGFAYMQKYPNLFRLQHERADDGYMIPSICPSIIYNGKQVFFDGRYFKTKLRLTDTKKFDTMIAFQKQREFLKLAHREDDAAKCRALNLQNRVAIINQKLARKERDTRPDE